MQLARAGALAAQPGWSSPGWITLQLCGAAGDAWVLLLSDRSAALDLGWLGLLRVDPASMLVFSAQALPRSPRLALGTAPLAVPPGLAGRTFRWQTLLVRSGLPTHLTNAIATGF